MGFFKNLFGGNKKQEVNFEPIDLNSKYGLIEYNKGEIYGKISSKSYSETFENFGFKGVQLHQQLKTHFKLIDILHDYFNNTTPRDLRIKKDWKSEDTNRYNFNQMKEVFTSLDLIKSHDVSLNIEKFINRNTLFYKNFYHEISNYGFPETKGKNNIKSYIVGHPVPSFVGFNSKLTNDSKTIEEFLSFLLGGNIEELVESLTFQVVGWNSVCLITPLNIVYTDWDFSERTIIIKSSDFNKDVPEPWLSKLHYREGISSDMKDSVLRWWRVYEHNYLELFISECIEIKELIESKFHLSEDIIELKKDSFEIHEGNEDFTNDSNMIIRHLIGIQNDIESIFDGVLMDNGGPLLQSRGYIFPNYRIYGTYELLEHKLFEFSVIRDLCYIMVDCVKTDNKFLYKEVYLILEPYHIFDKTIEKQTLHELSNISQKLSELNNKLSELNKNLETLNTTLTRGFKMLSQQLSSIDNKLWYNNLLTTINTYQLNKISKK